jgi:O-antigen ligase
VLHANGVAALTAVTATGWVAAAVVPGPAPRRVAAVVTAALLAVVLVATGSRGGLLALAGGALTAVAGRWHPLLVGAVAVTALSALAALVLAAAVTASPVDLRDPGRPTAPGVGGGVSDLGWRAVVWRGTLAGIAESPVLGRGIGSFPLAYAPDRTALQPVNSHESLLEVWLDLGLGGLLAVCGLTLQALVAAGRRAAASPLALAVAAAAVAWLTGSLVESTVLVSVSTAEPWRGTPEVAVPLAFVVWGLAAALQGARSPEGAR